jgi:hypothetical protein
MFRRAATATATFVALACTVTLLGGVPAGAAGRTAAAVERAAAPARSATLAASTVGRPPVNAPPRPGSVFNYPNRGKKAQTRIRNRVLNAINSTWGGPRNRHGVAYRDNGRIRIATWTFQDMAIAKALYRAHRRGVSVQVLAATKPNRPHRPWKWLRKKLKSRLYLTGHKETRNAWSFARHCRGSCRGPGGTPHSKYMLFTNVGSAHVRTITMSTSANLTDTAFKGQWNSATITWNPRVHVAFDRIFRESRLDRPVRGGAFRHWAHGGIDSIFFPRPGTSAPYDPVMRTLSHVRCTGATSGGSSRGRTRVRVVQYAMYDKRGVWIAKRLRSLWNAGCDVKIIYTAVNRPVLSILRARSGRGPIPMRQSVIRNSYGEIVKYNHNKWLSVSGRWGSSTHAWVTLTGSANWGNAAFSGDEQMLQLMNYGHTRSYLADFHRTWHQKSSRAPRAGRIMMGGRALPVEIAPEELTFGRGELKYLTED